MVVPLPVGDSVSVVVIPPKLVATLSTVPPFPSLLIRTVCLGMFPGCAVIMTAGPPNVTVCGGIAITVPEAV